MHAECRRGAGGDSAWLTSFKLLEQAEEVGSFPDAGEFNAEGLHLQEDGLDGNDSVADERGEEHTEQAH